MHSIESNPAEDRISLPPDRSSGAPRDPQVSVVPPELHAILAPLVDHKSGDLPVLPWVAQQAVALVGKPNVRYDELLGVVERDPPLAARILAVSNSAFYSRGIPVLSLKHAMVRLGTHALRDVVYTAIYANTIFDVPGLVDLVKETFEHSVVVARISRWMANQLGTDPDSAFLAGLLHDVGRARCYKLLAKRSDTRRLPRDVLRAAGDEYHERAGATLAEAWKLPEEVVHAIGSHHTPGESRAARLLAAADMAALHLEQPPRATLEQLVESLQRIGLDESMLPRIRQEAYRE